MRYHTLGLTFSLLHFASPQNICYYPNGDTQPHDVPCDPEAEVTGCCWSRAACLTNGLCIMGGAESDSGQEYARGTCTDRSWSSPLCPQNCQLNQDTPNNSSAYDFRADGVKVWQCGSQGYGREAEYCCESEAEGQRCCQTDTAVFVLTSATVGPYTGIESSSLLSLTSSATLSASTTPLPTPSRTGSAAQSSQSPPADASNRSDNKATTIGAGVGGALGGCLLTTLLVFFIRRHKNRRAALRLEESRAAVAEFNDKAELSTEETYAELSSQSQIKAVWELPGDERLPSYHANSR
ncbi:hypothetical protein BKA58DRAFT_404651 [Alternaria rosae]|uniref:uncharacterized protein n=1 Tax=Alternaria rosae TaxID=1187941 RepID=UPI001E8DB640|nr:uncharacterized protein BKA58DRAFT_404651 [Alternaria rosae]KAH6864843.1 hypothetical protein BKA58DRAFT_404651 [Alternaria rosae]